MPREHMISVRVSDEELEYLQAFAEAEGTSLSQALRTLIDQGGQRLDELEGYSD